MTKDGVKRACYIVKEYLRYVNNGYMDDCAVTYEEYELALKRILAFAFNKSDYDTVEYLGKCEVDCKYTDKLFCDGEFSVDKNHAEGPCRYYSPDWYK